VAICCLNYSQHNVCVDHKICERSRNAASCNQCNAGVDNCVPDKISDMAFSDHCKESVDQGECKVKPVASQDSITVDKGIGASGKPYNPSRLQAGSNKDLTAECSDQMGDLGELEGVQALTAFWEIEEG